jgi:hypothetical protein
MTYIKALEQFISNNQLFLTALLFCGSYFLKRLADYFAARPQTDAWDSIKPGTDALYSLVHRGVEYLATAKKLDSATKLIEYMRQIEQFEKLWNTDKAEAIKQLAAWYLSMQNKPISANPSQPTPELTADTPATE